MPQAFYFIHSRTNFISKSLYIYSRCSNKFFHPTFLFKVNYRIKKPPHIHVHFGKSRQRQDDFENITRTRCARDLRTTRQEKGRKINERKSLHKGKWREKERARKRDSEGEARGLVLANTTDAFRSTDNRGGRIRRHVSTVHIKDRASARAHKVVARLGIQTRISKPFTRNEDHRSARERERERWILFREHGSRSSDCQVHCILCESIKFNRFRVVLMPLEYFFRCVVIVQAQEHFVKQLQIDIS